MINWVFMIFYDKNTSYIFTITLQHGFTRHFNILIENMIISYLMSHVLILVVKSYFLRKGMSQRAAQALSAIYDP